MSNTFKDDKYKLQRKLTRKQQLEIERFDNTNRFHMRIKPDKKRNQRYDIQNEEYE